jgi:transposase
LAAFAAGVKLPFYQLSDAAQTELTELIRRPQQLVEMKAGEQTRSKRVVSSVQPSIRRHLASLTAELSALDDDRQRKIQENAELQKRDERLESVPGIGRLASATLLAELPELGGYSNKQLAALLCGLAPLVCESGRWLAARAGGRR